METKICGRCGEARPLNKFSASWCGFKNVCQRCLAAQDRARVKLQLLSAYGSQCVCCGEDHPHFLSLDHVGGKGSEVHRGSGRLNTEQIYRLARREGYPKDKYRLLCMNCNFAIGHFGVCPHKSGETASQVLADLEVRSKGTGRSLVRNEHTHFQPGHAKNEHAPRPDGKPKFIAIAPADLKAIGVTSDMIRQIIEGKNK